jgi:hypothetical protein
MPPSWLAGSGGAEQHRAPDGVRGDELDLQALAERQVGALAAPAHGRLSDLHDAVRGAGLDDDGVERSPTRGSSTSASAASTTARSSAAARRVAAVISSGSRGSAARTHSGTASPAATARQTSPTWRSASRRSGAVQWAYGSATPLCSTCSGCAPSKAV